ncbi:MAG: SPFH domain-containing protein [Alphaproteobacteria bacterium]|nr:SPFH domain-containing protein [Alphaproteobacteria bacterium]
MKLFLEILNEFKLIIIGIGVLVLALLCFMFVEKVPVGYKGLKVYTYATDQKGTIEPLGVGRYFIAPFRELYTFPTFSQNYTWDENRAISFQSKDGLTLQGDLMIRYYFQDNKIADLFSKFRLGANEIRDTIVRNVVRDKINRYSVNYNAEEAFSVKKNELLDNSLKDIQKELASFGIIVETLGFVGQIKLPEQVMTAINDKIEAKQVAEKQRSQIDTQKALTEAEITKQNGLAKAKIIEAESDAKANKLREQSLTPRVLEKQRLDIEARKVEKWNGVLPTYTGGNMPLLNIK